ncbi:MAG: tRNA 4-thiouridine(8) synthase ThiI, partial [Lachnospiraceae bacterium]|nr:tRNA 4-thiouridine(8) synthase ThiI [Lachnospiraceae bacterium]
MYQSFLIKYAEIATKGKNRYLFEDALVKQIRRALKPVDGSFVVTKESGRIYAHAQGEYDYEETIEALSRVFGIVGICPVVVLEDQGFEQLKEDVIAYMEWAHPDKNITFKVMSRRVRKNWPVDSQTMNAKLGEAVLNAFPQIRVDVHKPDIYLNVEIREKI